MDSSGVTTNFAPMLKFLNTVHEGICLLGESTIANIFATYQSESVLKMRDPTLPKIMPYIALIAIYPIVSWLKTQNLLIYEARRAFERPAYTLKAQQIRVWSLVNGEKRRLRIYLGHFAIHIP